MFKHHSKFYKDSRFSKLYGKNKNNFGQVSVREDIQQAQR